MNERTNVFFVCEQLYTLILIPFVLIKLVHINTMLYQLCFDIFWFIQLKTFQDIKTVSQRCWLSDIRVILCSVSFWFMKHQQWNKRANTHIGPHTHTYYLYVDTCSCLTTRLDSIVISANSSAGKMFAFSVGDLEAKLKEQVEYDVGQDEGGKLIKKTFCLPFHGNLKKSLIENIFTDWAEKANKTTFVVNDDVIFPPFQINQMIVSIFRNRFIAKSLRRPNSRRDWCDKKIESSHDLTNQTEGVRRWLVHCMNLIRRKQTNESNRIESFPSLITHKISQSWEFMLLSYIYFSFDTKRRLPREKFLFIVTPCELLKRWTRILGK